MNRIFFILMMALLFSACNTQEKKEVAESNDNKDIEGSMTAFDSLNMQIKNKPNAPSLYNKRANMFLMAGEVNAALSDVNKALQLDTLNAATWITLSDIYFAKERFVDSRQVLLKVLAMAPNNTDAMIKLARLHLIYRDYKMLNKYVDEALAIDPLLEEAHFIKATAYAEQGDTVSAVYTYQKVVDINPNFYDAWIELGRISEAKDNSLAEQYFLNALNIDTNNTHALYIMALYYQNAHDFNTAEQYYTSLLNKSENEYAYFNMGYINLVYLKDYKKAIIFFQKAINVNPDYYDALFNLAYSLELSGDLTDARLKYKELLAKVPNHEGAIERLNTMR